MGNKKRPSIGVTVDIEYGLFKLKKGYVSSILKAGGTPFLIPPNAEPEVYKDMLDGLLIPGGDDIDPGYYNEKMLFDMKVVPREKIDFEINLIREIMKSRKPMLGICYGMQLVNVALGGTLHQDIKGHRDCRHDIEVRENGFIPEGRYRVGSSHHQSVKDMGKGLEILAVSEDGVIEAVYGRDYPFLLCVQWHPEREEVDGISDKIFELFIGASSGNK